MNSVLTGKEKSTIVDGIRSQGGTIRELGNGMVRVLSPDLSTQFTMSLNSPSGLVVARDRSRVRKMGLVWPLDPDYEKPKEPKEAPVTKALPAKQTLINSFETTAKYIFANEKISADTIESVVERGIEMGLSEADASRLTSAVVKKLRVSNPELFEKPAPAPVPIPVPDPDPEPFAAKAGPMAPINHSAVASDVIEEWINLTPSLAEAYLEHNVNNRSVRQSHVEALARDMSAGRWKVTGDSIKFDINNELVDGQHRLMAVILSRVTIRVLLILGVQPDAREVIDGQATRSVADVLSIRSRGERNLTSLSSVARTALIRESGEWQHIDDTRTPVFSNAELVDWIDKHPDVHEAVDLAVATARFINVPVSAWGYCLYLFMKIDHDAAVQFADDVAELRTSGSKDPRFALISMFQRARADRRRIHRAAAIYYVIRSWNAWRKGEQLAKFSPAAGVTIPEPV